MADEDDKTKKEAEVEAASESTDQAADSTAEGTPESDNLQKTGFYLLNC